MHFDRVDSEVFSRFIRSRNRNVNIEGKSSKGLDASGWITLQTSFVDEASLSNFLVYLASTIGTPVAGRTGATCQRLQPVAKEDALPGSLSRRHGFEEFPLHIDTAHWLSPCRFVILGCIDPGVGQRPTNLLDTRLTDLSESDVKLLHVTPLRVRNGRNSFFGTILAKDRNFIRFDPGCMEPVSAAGEEALQLFSAHRWACQMAVVRWRPGQVLIVDNWRVLHGRGPSFPADHSRCLLRVLVR
jgi:hypothetical protein